MYLFWYRNVYFIQIILPPKYNSFLTFFSLMIKIYGRLCQYPIHIPLDVSIWEHYCPPALLSIANLSLSESFLWPIRSTASHPYPRNLSQWLTGVEISQLPHLLVITHKHVFLFGVRHPRVPHRHEAHCPRWKLAW